MGRSRVVSEVSGNLSGLDKYRCVLLFYILKFQQKIKEIVIQIAVVAWNPVKNKN